MGAPMLPSPMNPTAPVTTGSPVPRPRRAPPSRGRLPEPDGRLAQLVVAGQPAGTRSMRFVIPSDSVPSDIISMNSAAALPKSNQSRCHDHCQSPP